MKMTMQLEREMEAVSLRSAWLIRRACRPGSDIAHLAFDFGTGRERGNRVDHQHIDGTGTHQRIGDLQRLLARIGLRDQEVFEINTKLAGINRIERMLSIDEGANAALLLRLGNGVQGKCRLARAFRPVNLDDAALRQTADAKGDIQ